MADWRGSKLCVFQHTTVLNDWGRSQIMEAELIGLCYEHVLYILMAYRLCAVALCWTQHIYCGFQYAEWSQSGGWIYRFSNRMATSDSNKSSSDFCVWVRNMKVMKTRYVLSVQLHIRPKVGNKQCFLWCTKKCSVSMSVTSAVGALTAWNLIFRLNRDIIMTAPLCMNPGPWRNGFPSLM